MSGATFNEGPRRGVLDLQQDAELFRLLVHRVTDYAILALDRDGYIISWNSGAELVKGYRTEEIIGQHMRSFYTAEDQRVNKPLRLLKQARDQGRVEDEGWRVRKDGSRFWADVIITALYDDSGQLRAYAKITRDLTERRRADESLRQAKEDLERRVAERTTDLEGANTTLEERLAELERFHDLVVNRELKMIELEKKVRELEALIKAGGTIELPKSNPPKQSF